MPSKLVYVSADHHCASATLDILSPKQLDALLEQGFDIIKRSKKKIQHPDTKKTVSVEYIELATKSEDRGVSVTQRRNSPPAALVPFDDQGIGDRSLSTRSRSGSYLGDGSDFHDVMKASGIGITAGAGSQMAFSFGVDAAKLGKLADECPFGHGTKEHEEWMKGFAAGGGNMPVASSPEALAEAATLGRQAAKGGPNDEVSCPYPSSTDLYAAWLKAFEDAGGTVE